MFIVPELQVLSLFSAVYKPFFLCRRHEVQLESVNLVNQLVCDFLLVEGYEELRVRLDLLMEQLDNVRCDVVRKEAQLESLPKVDNDVVEVERVLIVLTFLSICMLGL